MVARKSAKKKSKAAKGHTCEFC